jgi:hypothetical protein
MQQKTKIYEGAFQLLYKFNLDFLSKILRACLETRLGEHAMQMRAAAMLQHVLS